MAEAAPKEAPKNPPKPPPPSAEAVKAIKNPSDAEIRLTALLDGLAAERDGRDAAAATCERAVAAALGAFVADAAAQPLHWIYDKGDLATALDEAEAANDEDEALGLVHGGDNRSDAGVGDAAFTRRAAFAATSRNPYYTLPTGSATCYGDQQLAVLRALAGAAAEPGDASGAEFPIEKYRAELRAAFAPEDGSEDGGPYGALDAPRAPADRPVAHGWRNKSVIQWLKKTPQAPDMTDEQVDGATKAGALAAAYAHGGDAYDAAALAAAARACAGETQAPKAVAAAEVAARVVAAVVNGASCKDAVKREVQRLVTMPAYEGAATAEKKKKPAAADDGEKDGDQDGEANGEANSDATGTGEGGGSAVDALDAAFAAADADQTPAKAKDGAKEGGDADGGGGGGGGGDGEGGGTGEAAVGALDAAFAADAAQAKEDLGDAFAGIEAEEDARARALHDALFSLGMALSEALDAHGAETPYVDVVAALGAG